MSWEFCTEPDFEEKLEWTRAFVRDEVMPLADDLVEQLQCW